ncbi:hypothetical protein NDU88_004126 [Pleurodeles waltl]|uniref:Uncharacterized protein n=1 Tax=Pleurodeles waltl TaxID=8319 RepID=A0AAV7UG94_PLEWA|nr:hypothetical protein NDU88_004126 [Pleurodeles waltl]
MLTGEEEEELDYDEDGEQVEAPQASTSGQAFRGERLSHQDVAANLSRGEGCVLGGTRSGFRVSTNVDVAIQAGGEGTESKVGDPMSAQEEAARHQESERSEHGHKQETVAARVPPQTRLEIGGIF